MKSFYKGLVALIMLLICFEKNVYANPIPITPQPIINPFIIDFVVDAIVLLIILYVIKEFKHINAIKIFEYIIVVYLNGILCDIISIIPVCIISGSNLVPNILIIVIFFCIGALLLYLSNFYISRVFFKMEYRKGVIIGLVMAIVTNPIIGVFINDINYDCTINFKDSLIKEFYIDYIKNIEVIHRITKCCRSPWHKDLNVTKKKY